jgi:arylsulfatase A-like enzyme
MNKLLWLIVCLLLIAPVARAAETSGRERPNILFIIFDDWSREHAGAYGCTWVKTPNFDRVAKEGVLFKNAFTSNPKCSPCRASILTGRNFYQNEEAASHGGMFPANAVVYPDLLEQAGYVVGLTGKGWGPGDFKTMAKRTRNPAGPSFDSRKATGQPAKGIGPLDYAANFQDFLDQRDKAKPFCFWMGFHEPHRPYEYGSGERLGKKLSDVVVPPFLPDTPVTRRDLLDYSVEVEYADGHIGRALQSLEKAGLLENTLVIVTSDHGMPFPYVKGQIFDDAFHLPLAMRWGKAIKPGRVVDDFINVRDLAPTYMELAGVKPAPSMTGKSLASILRSEKSGVIEKERDFMIAGKERHDIGRPNDMGYPVRAIRTGEYLYVHNFFPERWPVGNPETDFGNCDPGPTKEVIKFLGGYFYDLCFGKRPADALFKLSDDPRCVNNLANDPFYADTMQQLKYRLFETLKNEGDPRALGNGAIFDSYKYVGGRAKGYETWLNEQSKKVEEALKGKFEDTKADKKKRKAAEN